MEFQDNSCSKNNYVCPSDRQLALRAKLQTGWSSACKRAPLNDEEQRAIVLVIKRNEQLEMAERQRVGKLIERVERIKLRASYYGPKNCSLCGQSFGIGIFLKMTHKQLCLDCKKPVCSHCCVEISNSVTKKSIFCHLCSEVRDVYKKSGAWFYKGLPNYELPKRSGKDVHVDSGEQALKVTKTTKLGMEIDSDDEDEELDTLKDQKIYTHESTSNNFLRNKNLFNLRLSTESMSRFDSKSPNSPYSRQTSSSESQKSSNSLQPQGNHIDWENWNSNGCTHRQRKNSLSSCVSESASAIEAFNVNQDFWEPVVLGWLEVTINYDESQNTLLCTLLRARDLPGLDSQGLSDPFCKVNIITADNCLRHTQWQKSRTTHKTKNPEFNETLTFLGVSHEEMKASVLFVVCLDEDKFGNDFLGATKISLALIQTCKPLRITVPLGPEDRFSMEALSRKSSNGQILISLCYNTKRRALAVNIKRCINLLAMDKNGLSDPFVKLQLRPDFNRKKFKTNIKWRNLNPVFNEEFYFEARPTDLDKQVLLITVWDKDIGKSNDFLGALVLGQTSKGRRLKQWKDCFISPDQYHEQWHFLSSDLPKNF